MTVSFSPVSRKNGLSLFMHVCIPFCTTDYITYGMNLLIWIVTRNISLLFKCFRNKVQLFWERYKNVRNRPYGFEIYLVNVKTMRTVAQIFVLFTEKLNFNNKVVYLGPDPKIYETLCLDNLSPYYFLLCFVNLKKNTNSYKI